MINHGTIGGYKNGCKNACCKDAWSEYRKRAKTEPVPEQLHGKESTYTNRGCRCEECSEAHNLKRRRESRTVC